MTFGILASFLYLFTPDFVLRLSFIICFYAWMFMQLFRFEFPSLSTTNTENQQAEESDDVSDQRRKNLSKLKENLRQLPIRYYASYIAVILLELMWGNHDKPENFFGALSVSVLCVYAVRSVLFVNTSDNTHLWEDLPDFKKLKETMFKESNKDHDRHQEEQNHPPSRQQRRMQQRQALKEERKKQKKFGSAKK
eukprot:TRINITY_DN172_c0_g1_i1.p1 TRINITY_DN172_c0_g1~~TRINITY_DN172_c0_g1_i1.p1  ORF type:complete len:194 (-),score=27.34 TRINITY_DN172_c0_g1_i1:68-649(-)